MKPLLKLNRLVVLRGGARFYDESFHAGLNIIRGTNGSGKSTIMDLIFYVLGGDLTEWKEYAVTCDQVIAEVQASDVVLTLKREISQTSKRPMQIFFGPFEKAMSSAGDGWSQYPYSRNENNIKSFSQILFEILHLPELPGDEGSNITMHQIERLMYVDQSTPFQRIFRTERFDGKDTRGAVAELLCGVGGYELYSKRLKHRDVKRELNEAVTEYSNLLKATSALEENMSVTSIEAEKKVTVQKQDKLYKELAELEAGSIDQAEVAKEAAKSRRELHQKISNIRDEIISLEKEEQSTNFEIEDSKAYIQYLNETLSHFDNASNTYALLGRIQFVRCPACLSPLAEAKAGCCNLCGNADIKEDQKSRVIAIKLDIEGQIVESDRLQKSRLEHIASISKKLKSFRLSYSQEAKKFNEFQHASVDGFTASIAEKNQEIGLLRGRLRELEGLQSLVQELAVLGARKEKLNTDLSTLTDEIAALEVSVAKRRKIILTKIAENTKYFLGLDLKEHNDFDQLEKFDFSFEDDWFAVNGQPNISTSASGMVVVKNSLFMGLMKTATSDAEMLFPRFMLLDNVEDKGMVAKRVQHFQKIIADWSQGEEQEHQIIITTSTLNPELDKKEYVVGEAYTRESRTLKPKSAPPPEKTTENPAH